MSTKDEKAMSYLAAWTTVLTVFWLLLSGYFKPLLLGFGVVSLVLVLYLLRCMDSVDKQRQMPPLNLTFFRYAVWLVIKIVNSSLKVTKLVWLGNSKDLSPALAKLPVSHIPNCNRVLFANSITLTPGTLSIDIDDEHLTVHALRERSIKSLQTGEMALKVSSVKGAIN